MVRSGYKTSEFWFTLVSFIFSGLFLLGIIGDASYKEELIRDVSHAVESVILISGQLFLVYRYIRGREDVKKMSLKEESATKVSTKKSSTKKPASSKTTKKTTPKKK